MDQLHPTRETLEAFTWRQLPAAEMLSLSDHLCDCAECRAGIAALASHQRAPQSIDHFLGEDHSLHLSEDELASAALDAPMLSAQARAHLEACADCRADVSDARSFAPRLQLVPPKQTPRAKLIAWPLWGLAAAAAIALAVFIGHSRLNPNTAQPLVAELRDNGNLIGLTPQGTVTGIASLSTGDAALLAQTLNSRRLPSPPQSLATSQSPETLRGGPATGEAFRLLNPTAEVTLPSPQFFWEALPGASAYRVFVYDHAFKLAAQSPALTALSWSVDRSLDPGETYTWVVKASTPHGTVQSPRPPAPEVHFTVADSAVAAKIAAAQRQSPSHLLLATLYASEGMISLSQREMDALQKENPNSTLVQQLASSIQPAR